MFSVTFIIWKLFPLSPLGQWLGYVLFLKEYVKKYPAYTHYEIKHTFLARKSWMRNCNVAENFEYFKNPSRINYGNYY